MQKHTYINSSGSIKRHSNQQIAAKIYSYTKENNFWRDKKKIAHKGVKCQEKEIRCKTLHKRIDLNELNEVFNSQFSILNFQFYYCDIVKIPNLLGAQRIKHCVHAKKPKYKISK